MIAGSSLSVEIGGRVLVRDGSLLVTTGEKVGLVGRNGTGKSTLLSVVIGEPAPAVRSTGTLKITGTVATLPQVPAPGGLGLDPSGFSHVLSARGLDVLDDSLGKARVQMAKDPTEENIGRFSDLEEQFRSAGGYEAEATMARLADGLGLDQSLLMEDISRLSGGQRRRLDLVRILFQSPEVMILDEPTNHLDMPAKRWLMGELARFPGSLLLVSHDLRLLDASITKVLHLADGHLREFKGTYTSYRRQLAADQERRERAADLEGREMARLRTLADSMRGSTNRRARTAKALDRRVERLAASTTTVYGRERTTAFKLPVPPQSGQTPLEVAGLSVRYGTTEVLSDVTLHASRGDRIVVVGRNGAGKSSLLRCLAGIQAPTTGQVATGLHTTVGYFAQEHEQVNPDLTVLGNLDSSVLSTETQRRALLGSFGLPPEAAHQRPGTLSGGERAKLGLAMLAASQANLLLLDEPTNNLDPASVSAVGLMLSQWEGTMVVVSHDRSFVEALEPSHCLVLPQETFTHWRHDYLDQVELK